MKNKVYDRYELLYGLIQLAEECEDAEYWRLKAKESKDLIELNLVNDYECKIDNYQTKMRIIVGEEQGKLIWAEFCELMHELADEKYKDFEELRLKNLPISYGVVKDYTLLDGYNKRKKVKVKVNFQEYTIKQEVHFFMEYFYERYMLNKDMFFDVGTTIIDLKDCPILEQRGRNLPESYKDMDYIFHSEELKSIKNELFGEVDDGGGYYCLVDFWDNMVDWGSRDI